MIPMSHLSLVQCEQIKFRSKKNVKMKVSQKKVSQKAYVDFVGCFGFNGPLRQYFSLYRAVS